MAPSKIFTRSDNTRSFLWGYYFHLIADCIWVENYLLPKQKVYDLENHENKDFIGIMREEIYAIDFLYLQQQGNGVIERFKEINQDLVFFNEFQPSHIYECQQKIVENYGKDQYTLHRDYRFYSLEIIEEFINEATQKCIEILL